MWHHRCPYRACMLPGAIIALFGLIVGVVSTVVLALSLQK